jgi:hypothetical protein
MTANGKSKFPELLTNWSDVSLTVSLSSRLPNRTRSVPP